MVFFFFQDNDSVKIILGNMWKILNVGRSTYSEKSSPGIVVLHVFEKVFAVTVTVFLRFVNLSSSDTTQAPIESYVRPVTLVIVRNGVIGS